jgi:hypothetical protein
MSVLLDWLGSATSTVNLAVDPARGFNDQIFANAGLGPKGADFTEQLQKYFLSEIFSPRRIPVHHPQTQSV